MKHNTKNHSHSSYARRNFLVLIALLLFVTIAALSVIYYYASLPVQSLHISNVTPNSATIVWTTSVPTVGAITITEKGEKTSFVSSLWQMVQNSRLFADTRDVTEVSPGVYERQTRTSRYTHHVTVINLEPDTEYSFRPVHTLTVAKESELFSFKTAIDSSNLSEPKPVYGTIEFDNEVDFNDVVLMAQVVERNTRELEMEKSQRVSVPLSKGTFVLDVGNLRNDSLEDEYPSLLGNEDEYTLNFLVLTKDGQFPYLVTDTEFQPLNTIVIDGVRTETSSRNPLVTPVYAKCDSTCVGDCQGCNLDTPSDPLCKTYGCGYMSWCCGYQSACANHCSNGKQDCDETGVDCGGGGCATCGGGRPETSGECAGQCKRYDGNGCTPKNPVSGTCECAVNGKKDADETAMDCGGAYCPACTNAGSHCFNRVQDQGEEGVDCGGDCAGSCSRSAPQPVGKKCTNEGEIFTCSDRTDWECWCLNGQVATYHRKGVSVISKSQPSRVYREGLVKFRTNSKFGVHTGVGPGIANYGYLVDQGNVGYIMNVITDPGQLEALINEYRNLPDGVVPIVRFCHAEQTNSCPFTDPAAAEAFSEALAQAVGKPVAIISGPNEPLQEPWTVAANYPQCAGKSGNELVACSTAQWMNEFVARTGDTSNIIKLSPDFNTSEPAFLEFVAQMKANGANFQALDGVAGNAYEGAGGKTIAQAIQELKDLGFDEIYITEAGVDPNLRSSDPEQYQRLLSAIDQVADDPQLKSLLLFNPLPGLSPDPNFDKHEFSQDQYNALAAEMSGTGQTQTYTAAPGYVVETASGAASSAPSGFSCNRGTRVTDGGAVCCRGERDLSICVDSSGNSFIKTGLSIDARHTQIQVDNQGRPFSGPETDDGRQDLGNFSNTACIRNHDWGNASTPEHEWMCVQKGGGSVGVGAGQGSLSGFRTLLNQVFAQNLDKEYEPGVYSVTGLNVEITTKTIDVVSPGVISFYYDTNENGQRDEGEEYLTDEQAQALQVNFDKKVDLYNYTVDTGWNSFSFPMLMSDSSTAHIKSAADLLTYMNVVGITTTHVAVYRDQQFVFYSERLDENGDLKMYGSDFGILPGEAYFVKVYDSGTFSIAGYRPSASIPITLNSGWNLVGMYSSKSNELEALETLKAIQNKDIPSDMLVKWENNRYEGVVYQNNQEYGHNFTLFPTIGYWVRVNAESAFEGTTYTP